MDDRKVTVKYEYNDGSSREVTRALVGIKYAGIKSDKGLRPIKVTLPYWVSTTEYWHDTLSKVYEYGLFPGGFEVIFTYDMRGED